LPSPGEFRYPALSGKTDGHYEGPLTTLKRKRPPRARNDEIDPKRKCVRPFAKGGAAAGV